MSNSISKCFELEGAPSAIASVDILVEYCMDLPRSESLNVILTQNFWNILNGEDKFPRFSEFFKNQELEDVEGIKSGRTHVTCSLSHLLYNQYLPHFGNGKEYLEPFAFKSKVKANMTIPGLVKIRDSIVID